MISQEAPVASPSSRSMPNTAPRQVASTIIGATSVAQLDENLDAWGTTLSPELLAEIDKIRWEMRDLAN